jgi:hypothetical protein
MWICFSEELWHTLSICVGADCLWSVGFKNIVFAGVGRLKGYNLSYTSDYEKIVITGFFDVSQT